MQTHYTEICLQNNLKLELYIFLDDETNKGNVADWNVSRALRRDRLIEQTELMALNVVFPSLDTIPQ